MTLGSTGNISVEELTFSGTNTLDNSLGGTLSATDVEFSTTTYIVSSSTTAIVADSIDVGSDLIVANIVR